MAQDKKKKSAPADVQRVQNTLVGEILRKARADKGLELEKVAASINIRVAQLKAIEDGDIDALPGMTYALGFVRSYANFLKLNSAEIVHKFKTEHGANRPLKTEIHLPEPIQENHLPGPMMIGIAAFCAIVVLVVWSFASSDDGAMQQQAEIGIPLPPVDVTAEVAALPTMDSTLPTLPPMTEMTAVAPEAMPAPALVPVEEVAPASPVTVEAQEAESVSEPEETPVEMIESAVSGVTTAAEDNQQIVLTPPVPGPKPSPEDVINIKSGKGRIVIVAKQSSWVEVVDLNQNRLFKKVMRPGDQYYVPDKKGLSMITANAGGIEIYVDGDAVQPVGKPGQIVRGVILDPGELKKKKIRTRD